MVYADAKKHHPDGRKFGTGVYAGVKGRWALESLSLERTVPGARI